MTSPAADSTRSPWLYTPRRQLSIWREYQPWLIVPTAHWEKAQKTNSRPSRQQQNNISPLLLASTADKTTAYHQCGSKIHAKDGAPPLWRSRFEFTGQIWSPFSLTSGPPQITVRLDPRVITGHGRLEPWSPLRRNVTVGPQPT